MTEIAESDPKSLILVIADMARSNPPMVGPFVAELVRRFQDHGLALALPLTWVEQRLAESSLTIEQMVQSETQQQAADQVSVSNTIGSLRSLGAMDWRVFVEAMSLVEEALRADPGECLPVDGLRDPRPLSARGGAAGEAQPAVGVRGGAGRDRPRPGQRRPSRPPAPHGSRGQLPDRARRSPAGKRRALSPPAHAARAPMDRPVPAVPVPRRDPGDDTADRRSTACPDARCGLVGLAPGAGRRPRHDCRQPARIRAGELAVDPAGHPAAPAAHGLLARPAGGTPDARRGAFASQQRSAMSKRCSTRSKSGFSATRTRTCGSAC